MLCKSVLGEGWRLMMVRDVMDGVRNKRREKRGEGGKGKGRRDTGR